LVASLVAIHILEENSSIYAISTRVGKLNSLFLDLASSIKYYILSFKK
jgi:hypothetical protein